ncbi:unnamed protein product, partial [Closterium sp. Yama58-4]
VRWWRAQATRFLMRWPSLHLCHVTNLIRHVSISHHVAARLAFFEDTQAEIIRDVAADTAGEGARSDVRKSKQAKELQGMELGKGVEIESVSKASWATIGGRCSVCEEEGWKGEVMGGDGEVGESWDMQAGVSSANVKKAGLEKKEKHVLYYVQKHNNLVVGVGREAESGKLSALMHHVHQLRLLEPHLAHVWLHTPSQALLTKASNYHDWTFLHSTNRTSPDALQDSGAAAEPAAEARALASLLVAAQGDFFVGGLGSHWGRLVNELRSTNGRLFNVFVAMDDDEW